MMANEIGKSGTGLERIFDWTGSLMHCIQEEIVTLALCNYSKMNHELWRKLALCRYTVFRKILSACRRSTYKNLPAAAQIRKYCLLFKYSKEGFPKQRITAPRG